MSLHFHCRFAYPSGFRLELSFCADVGVTALWGPSGAGKTTVLNLIAGVLRPDFGAIRLGDRTLFDSEQRIDVPLHLRRIGYVFQDYQLFPHLTVAQNLAYGAKRSKQTTIPQERLIEILGLGPLLKQYPRTLSGGEQQRVALGRALASGPELLLLDEPVSALDMDRKSSILSYLETVLCEFQLPAVIVSHDAAILERLNARRIELGV
jgi:molybdate transport system ATP-binding protein